MRIAVLGATGRSGLEVLKEALLRNHDVIALVRNPAGINIQHEKLKVKKSNIFEQSELEGHIKECDAVVSCLGTNPGFLGWSPVTFYTDSMKTITQAMRKTDCRRIVCMSSWCTRPGPTPLRFFEWFIRPFFIGNLLKNLAEMEDFLEEKCSDINYTVVRPPYLSNADSSGKEIKTEDGQYVSDGSMMGIPRRDVAIFILNCVERGEWMKKFVSIAV